LGVDVDWFGLLDGLLTGSWLLLLQLGEVWNDPDVVESVSDTNGAGEKEDVEEDPVPVSHNNGPSGRHSHLRIKEAGIRVNNRHRAIISLHGIECLILADDSCQVEANFLRVHVGLEAVRKSLLFTGRDLNRELLCGEIAHNARSLGIEIGGPKTPSNELHSDGFGLLVGEGDQGVGRLPIDELDAKDLSIWEGC
jgi:hypothetical protein